MAGEIVVGLDVGTTKVCALVGEVGPNGSVVITGVGITPCGGLRKGVVVDLQETSRAIRESIEKAAGKAQVEIHSVTVGVTGEHIASVNTRGGVAISHPGEEITDADRDRALEQARVILCPPNRQILHVEPRRYIVDGQEGILSPVGMAGSRLEVEAHVVHAERSFIDNVVKAVERANLVIDAGGIFMGSLAAAEAVLTQEERSLGVALIDIGGGTTDLAVFHEGTVCHSAVIPVGGWNVTHDLSQGLKVSEEEAERLKKEYGTADMDEVSDEEIIDIRRPAADEPIPLPRELLAQIIAPRMEELFEMVGKEIAEASIGKPGAGLVVTGGGAQLPGALPVAERVLAGLETRLGLPRCAGGMADAIAKPPFAVAVGLVMLAARRHSDDRVGLEEGHLLGPTQRWFRKLTNGVFRKHGSR